MKRLIERMNLRPAPYIGAAIGLLTLWAFVQKFPMDDAFISFRYAKHLAEGLGLVWNAGERVEGYSNFLWVLICSAGLKIGVFPENFANIVNFPLYILSLYLTWRLARRYTNSAGSAIGVVLLTGFTRSFYTFPTSGMETTLQSVEFLGLSLLLVKSHNEWDIRWSILVGSLLAVMFLTRPDAAVPALAVFWILRSKRPNLDKIVWMGFFVPLILVGFPYAIWKISYFGDLLPNSFHTKVRDIIGVAYGLFYINQFLLSHLLYPLAATVVWRLKELRESSDEGLSAIMTLTVFWLAYVVLAGGDFMEFRFLTPILPMMYLLIVRSIELIVQPRLRVALAAALAFGVLYGNFAMEHLVFGYGIESVAHLRGHLNGESENWALIGKKLKEYFGGSNVVISAGAAGAIPYYSELTTIDFMGLNDRRIPREGEPFSRVPGHRVIATVEYLSQRGVNFIIEPNNYMLDLQEFAALAMGPSWRDLYRFYLDPDRPIKGKQLTSTSLVGIPMDKDHVLVVWYLTPSPVVEQAIRDNGWPRFVVTRW